MSGSGAFAAGALFKSTVGGTDFAAAQATMHGTPLSSIYGSQSSELVKVFISQDGGATWSG
jgi:hypothetical protein